MVSSSVESRKVVALARIVHAANAAFCESIGDTSQVPWNEMTDDLRESAIKGVQSVLDNPLITGEEMHEAWMQTKREQGWVYGDVKDPDKKTHPCMIEYSKLSVEQRFKDDLFIGLINIYLDFKDHHTTTVSLDDSEEETLKLLFLSGPVEDGNLPSKSTRDTLCQKGYVFARNGFQSLTPKGLDVCLSLEFDREKEKEQSRV